jgi:hypothetical protein
MLGERRQIIMFSDLECDYINPIDLCNKLNQVSSIGDPYFHSVSGGSRTLTHAHAHATLVT